jgi:hypothetical protein
VTWHPKDFIKVPMTEIRMRANILLVSLNAHTDSTEAEKYLNLPMVSVTLTTLMSLLVSPR